MTSFLRNFGDENIPTTFILIGAAMLSWLFFLGDIVLPYIQ